MSASRSDRCSSSSAAASAVLHAVLLCGAFTSSALGASLADETPVLHEIFESLQGHSWVNASRWLSKDDPCSWPGVRCRHGLVAELHLSSAGMAGWLPSDIADLPELEKFEMARSEALSGTIPESLCTISKLRKLTLGRTRISGTLPASCLHLPQLEHFYLKRSKLSGTLPSELDVASPASVPFSTLQVLDIADTKGLSGTLPAYLGSFSNLRELHLDRNRISGTIPIQLQHLGKLHGCSLAEGNALKCPMVPNNMWSLPRACSVQDASSSSCLRLRNEYDSKLRSSAEADLEPLREKKAADGHGLHHDFGLWFGVSLGVCALAVCAALIAWYKHVEMPCAARLRLLILRPSTSTDAGTWATSSAVSEPLRAAPAQEMNMTQMGVPTACFGSATSPRGAIPRQEQQIGTGR